MKEPLRRSVGIAIVNWNAGHQLQQCVTSIADARWDAVRLDSVVIVDNGSTDGTDRVARELVAAHSEVRFLQLPQRGRGRALRHAWTQSDADIMCYTDVDLSTELTALPKMVHGIVADGFDLATGSRLLRESRTTRSARRELISRCYNLFVKGVLWTSFSDAQCGFKAISRAAVLGLVPDVQDQGWFFDTEILVLAEKRGYRIADIPVEWIEDDDSRVKIVKTAWDDIKGVFRLRLTLWRELLSSRPAPARALNKRSSP